MVPEPQIIIADGQFLIVEGLHPFLFKTFGINVIRIVSEKAELVAAASEHPHAVLIIDPLLLNFTDLSEFRNFLKAHPLLQPLVLTNSLSRNEFSELNAMGIRNIILKTAGRDELMAAMHAALAGKKYFCQAVLDIITEIQPGKGMVREPFHLTQTEIEIVRAVAEGYTTKQIAVSKHISYHTVMTHRKNIFRKLNVNNASELVMYAIRAGIIDTIEYNI
jgi:DNA-binding NarL/FixJ family response regulator